MIGLVLSILIGAVSMLIARIHPSFDSLVISIILGMLIGNLFEKRFFLQSGLNICIKVFLPAGIILYGSQFVINLENLSHLFIVPFIFALSFISTLLISHLFKIKGPFAILLSVGLSVCGASAIVVLSPLIGAKKEETSLSIISIMVIGLIGLIVYPMVFTDLGPNIERYAFITGATLPMLGQVKIVGSLLNEHAIHEALNYKLMRISMLILLIIWFGFLKREKRDTEGFISFPYLIRLILVSGFLFMVILLNFVVENGAGLKNFLEPLSRFFLTVTLAAIGLSVDFDSIAEIGPRPLYAVFISWILMNLIVYTTGIILTDYSLANF